MNWGGSLPASGGDEGGTGGPIPLGRRGAEMGVRSFPDQFGGGRLRIGVHGRRARAR
jgi:hypothetical protein